MGGKPNIILDSDEYTVSKQSVFTTTSCKCVSVFFFPLRFVVLDLRSIKLHIAGRCVKKEALHKPNILLVLGPKS